MVEVLGWGWGGGGKGVRRVHVLTDLSAPRFSDPFAEIKELGTEF